MKLLRNIEKIFSNIILEVKMNELLKEMPNKTKARSIDIKDVELVYDIPYNKGRVIRFKVVGTKGDTYFTSFYFKNKYDIWSDLKVKCTCPYFQWWGSGWNAKNEQYALRRTAGDTYPPNIRDPKRENKICKHVVAAFNKIKDLPKKYVQKEFPFMKKLPKEKQLEFLYEPKTSQAKSSEQQLELNLEDIFKPMSPEERSEAGNNIGYKIIGITAGNPYGVGKGKIPDELSQIKYYRDKPKERVWKITVKMPDEHLAEAIMFGYKWIKEKKFRSISDVYWMYDRKGNYVIRFEVLESLPKEEAIKKVKELILVYSSKDISNLKGAIYEDIFKPMSWHERREVTEKVGKFDVLKVRQREIKGEQKFSVENKEWGVLIETESESLAFDIWHAYHDWPSGKADQELSNLFCKLEDLRMTTAEPFRDEKVKIGYRGLWFWYRMEYASSKESALKITDMIVKHFASKEMSEVFQYPPLTTPQQIKEASLFQPMQGKELQSVINQYKWNITKIWKGKTQRTSWTRDKTYFGGGAVWKVIVHFQEGNLPHTIKDDFEDYKYYGSMKNHPKDTKSPVTKKAIQMFKGIIDVPSVGGNKVRFELPEDLTEEEARNYVSTLIKYYITLPLDESIFQPMKSKERKAVGNTLGRYSLGTVESYPSEQFPPEIWSIEVKDFNEYVGYAIHNDFISFIQKYRGKKYQEKLKEHPLFKNVDDIRMGKVGGQGTSEEGYSYSRMFFEMRNLDKEASVKDVDKIIQYYASHEINESSIAMTPSLQEPDLTDKDMASYKGESFWFGVVDLRDGQIVETHTYQSAKAVGFHHSKLVGEDAWEGLNEGDYAVFWIQSGNIAHWGNVPKNIIQRIEQQIELNQGSLNEVNLRNRIGRALIPGAAALALGMGTGQAVAKPEQPPVVDVRQVQQNQPVAEVIAGEAAGEGYRGMVAVGNVINRRAAQQGMSANQVALQKKGGVWQFSVNGRADVKERNYRAVKQSADWIAANLKTLPDITGGADHFTTVGWYNENKGKGLWIDSMDVTVEIGNLIFFKQKPGLSQHFSRKEFSCRHCGKLTIDNRLIDKLEQLREKIGKPIKVTSGYRCPVHNKKVGGVKNSRHTKGQAADIKVDGMTPREVAVAAREVGFGYVLIEPTWLHVDVR